MIRIDNQTVGAIEGHFHALILERTRALGHHDGLSLPGLASLLAGTEARAWLPVPGMHGGFSYWFEGEGQSAKLVVESWSRVVGGSGQRHEVTARGVRLLDKGLV